MNKQSLSALYSDKLLKFEHSLYERLDRENDDERLYAALSGIYVEIIREITKADDEKTLIIHDYAKLLQQEIQLYSGTQAYIMGSEANKAPVDAILHCYQLKIADEKCILDAQIQALFSEIALLLGEYHGLLDEFTEVYRQVHGVVRNNIAEFVRLGQYSA